MSTTAWWTRRKWLGLGVAATATAAGLGLAWQSRFRSTAAQAAFWQQQFKDQQDRVRAMSDFAGKPLLLNFWATWCPPCLEELPLLDSFFNQNKVNGLQMLGLAVDQEPSVKHFLAHSPLSYPVGLVGYPGLQWSRSLGNEAGGLPFTVFFDATGRMLGHKIGALNPDDLRAWALSQGKNATGTSL